MDAAAGRGAQRGAGKDKTNEPKADLFMICVLWSETQARHDGTALSLADR
jgi:hypothetical protein